MRMTRTKMTAACAAMTVAVALAGCAPGTATSEARPEEAAPIPVAETAQPTASEVTPSATVTESETITVSAHAEVKVTPEKASFDVTVTSEAETASAAQRANAGPVGDVVDALKDAGVDEKAIQTTYSSVGRAWNADAIDANTIDSDNEGGEDDGDADTYEATTRLRVSDVDVDKLATLMKVAVDAGATGVDGPDYATDSYDDAYVEALAAAVEAARPKAEAIAKAAGVTLGEVSAVSEGYQDTTYRAATTAEALGTNEDVAAIEPGQVSVTANVTVSFAIER